MHKEQRSVIKRNRFASNYNDETFYHCQSVPEKKREQGEDDGSEDSEVEDVRVEMPLPPGVLKVNLGIPIIVVCNKIDLLQSSGEKSKFLEENLDFIQKHVREYSLQYGATVMCTSAKSN